ncbi:hypothetical protein KO488_03570 [Poseidonibacter lekithochrous]|uniref:hypothetical protein n=1 Tax=Poseidonibacter TaxID=2321187 RepID=UPI001C080365|nr:MULTISPECIES: hypothetical protein [Poseidonibacter]MBU3013822.1 hypothetical protein [Poseidonibacter lekithochrous]MDO6827118.1 hypothetical protein [Poseidonibacter sp. 1_MG-2023]
MKYISNILLLSMILLFTACSSKNQVRINEQMNTFSLYKNVVILSAPKTIPSPFSVGLGVGGSLSRHVGISMGTVFRPDIENDEALDLERSIAVHNVSLQNLVKDEFSKAMRNDAYYKNKYTAFGADYQVHLFVPKYIIDKSILTSNAYVKVYLDLEIVNRNGDVIYSDRAVNDSKYYGEDSLLNNKVLLEDALRTSIQKSIQELIINMKKS